MKKIFTIVIILLFLFTPTAVAFDPGDGLNKGDIYCDPIPIGYAKGFVLYINEVRYPTAGEVDFTMIDLVAYPDPNLADHAYIVYSAKNLEAGDKEVTARWVNGWNEEGPDSVPLLFARPALLGSPAGTKVKE